MKIYAEHEKPKTSKLKKRQQHKFWKYNLSPITGCVTSKNMQQQTIDLTAEVIEIKKPAFRLAI